MLVFPRSGGTKPRIAIFFLVGVACIGGCLANPIASQDSIPPLPVSVQVIGQKYEYVDQQVFLTVLDMKVRFTNTQGRPLILYRGPAVDVGSFALDREGLESGRIVFQDRPYHLYAADYPIPTLSAKPSRRHFIVLNPDQSFEKKASYGVATRCRASENVPGSIQRGRLVARFVVDPWPFPKDSVQIKETQQKWSNQGTWITDPIQSDPVQIFIPDEAGLRQCKGKTK